MGRHETSLVRIGRRAVDPGAAHPGFKACPTPWGTVTILATDEVESVEPVRWEPPPPGHEPLPDDVLARLGGVSDVTLVGTGTPALMAGIWPRDSGPDSGGIGTNFDALFGRDLFTALRSLRPAYPIRRFTNLLLAVDEVVRHQGRERERGRDAGLYDARHEAPGKFFHELRDPADPLAREISAITGCAWPWYAADDVTGDGVSYIMEEALRDPSLLRRRVVQPDGVEIYYAQAVVEGLLWELREMERHGRWLILSHRLRRPAGSMWMPPLGSSWKDSPDGYLRLDGTLPTRPTALVEVNAILYASLRLAARLSVASPSFEQLLAESMPRGFGFASLRPARALEVVAERVRSDFLETFWVDNDGGGFPGYFAELDEEGRKLEVVPVLTSGVIDALYYGLFDGPAHVDRLHAVMRSVYDPSFGLRGVLGPRALGRFSPHYMPHGGNSGIWPHMTDKAATAAERHGFHQCALHDSRLIERICSATRALPEFVIDAQQPALDQVRVKVWRRGPDRYLTTAIEPGKPWQLWTLGALVSARDRLSRLGSLEAGTTLDLDAKLASRLPRPGRV